MSAASDELEEYLKVPAMNGIQDPLAWWTMLGDSPLARMGRDFMSAPGKHHDICMSQDITNAIYSISASSCDVERAFSRGGLTVTKLRHALSDESTRSATVLHSWHGFPELIPHAEIIQMFKEKSGRHKKETSEGNGMVDSSHSDIEVIS